MGIPYYEIPIRTTKNRLGKYVLMGFLEQLDELTADEIDSQSGKETYRSDM